MIGPRWKRKSFVDDGIPPDKVPFWSRFHRWNGFRHDRGRSAASARAVPRRPQKLSKKAMKKLQKGGYQKLSKNQKKTFRRQQAQAELGRQINERQEEMGRHKKVRAQQLQEIKRKRISDIRLQNLSNKREVHAVPDPGRYTPALSKQDASPKVSTSSTTTPDIFFSRLVFYLSNPIAIQIAI